MDLYKYILGRDIDIDTSHIMDFYWSYSPNELSKNDKFNETKNTVKIDFSKLEKLTLNKQCFNNYSNIKSAAAAA